MFGEEYQSHIAYGQRKALGGDVASSGTLLDSQTFRIGFKQSPRPTFTADVYNLTDMPQSRSCLLGYVCNQYLTQIQSI